MPHPTLRILFVCLGNICRSPAGEGVLTGLVRDAGLGDRVTVDSAGTIGLQAGKPPYPAMRKAAARRGYELDGAARQITPDDLDRFDLILAMDQHNYRDVFALATTEAQRERIRAFTSFCREHEARAVPDPYGGGRSEFEHALDLIEDGCRGVLDWAREQLAAAATR